MEKYLEIGNSLALYPTNLGNDPEMRYTPTGIAVAHFDVAVNRNWIDESGEKHEKTTLMRVTAWRKLAETCTKYLLKGKRVLVVGELEEPSAYLDKEGNARASNEVTAQRIVFLSPVNGDSAEAQESSASQETPF